MILRLGSLNYSIDFWCLFRKEKNGEPYNLSCCIFLIGVSESRLVDVQNTSYIRNFCELIVETFLNLLIGDEEEVS